MAQVPDSGGINGTDSACHGTSSNQDEQKKKRRNRGMCWHLRIARGTLLNLESDLDEQEKSERRCTVKLHTQPLRQ
jgi:hypothetical protein